MKKIKTKDWNDIFYDHKGEYTMSNFAFPLYIFTKRLYASLKAQGVRDVLFLSREGQFLKKLFDSYQQINGYPQPASIKSHYFYGSRNSIMAASLKPLDREDFHFLFRYFKVMSMESFLTSIGFSKAQTECVCKSFPKTSGMLHLNFAISPAFHKLKENPDFVKFYEENRIAQSKALEAYLNSFGIDFAKDGMTVVDIGYHGTMQDLLNKYFDGKVKLRGFYIKNRVESSEGNKKTGLLADVQNKELEDSKITSYGAFHYEQILKADHGRCTGYSPEGTPILDQSGDDKQIYDTFARDLQNQIFEKFLQIARKDGSEHSFTCRIAAQAYIQMIRQKSHRDRELFYNMLYAHHDDFGVVGYSAHPFSKEFIQFFFKAEDRLFLDKHPHLRKNKTLR